jgi:hypothetical protein
MKKPSKCICAAYVSMLQYGDRAKLCLFCLTAVADSLIGDVFNADVSRTDCMALSDG